MGAERYFLLSRKPRASAPSRIRLIAHGFAGGTVTSLLPFLKLLPSWIEVWGAEYPGRGLRWRTQPMTSAEALLKDLAPALSDIAAGPTVLFGYSMGAQLAYRLAARMQTPPLGIIVASAPAPRGLRKASLHRLDDTQLLAQVQALGGIPKEIVASETLLDAFMQALRADLACCDSINDLPLSTLSCPIFVLQGQDDPLMTPPDIASWRHLSTQRGYEASHRSYPAGHFLHKGLEADIARDIADWMLTLMHKHDRQSARIGCTSMIANAN